MFAIGFKLLSIAAPKIVEYVVDASASMGAGEFIQKNYEYMLDISENEYINIISNKTAKLLEASAKSGAAVADTDSDHLEAVGEFAYYLGIAFQIVDDIFDVVGDPNSTGKPVGVDLLEGNPTLPIIYAIEDHIYGSRIKQLFIS